MAVDLLAVGQDLAELDLVVRQLDDGDLTVARDDTLPDAQRVRLRATPDGGLVASVAVGGAGPDVERRAAEVKDLPRGGLVVKDGAARLEVTLAPVGGAFPLEALRSLVDDVLRGADIARSALQAPPPGKEADPNAATAAFELVESRKDAPVARPTGKLAPLPGSYLPGAGQHNAPTTTQRYGAIGQVPGRAEVTPEERRRDEQRRASGRQHVSSGGGGGGGGGGLVVALVLLLVLGGIAGAGILIAQRRAASAPPAPPSLPSQPPAATTPDAPSIPGPVTPDAPATPPDTSTPAPPPRPPVATPAPPPRAPRTDELTEDQVLERVKAPATRAAALDAWVAQGLDRVEGARLRMLQALGADAGTDAKASRVLTQSLRNTSPGPDEAIACLPLTRGNARRALIQLAGEAKEEKERLAAALAALPEDTEDLLVEESLLRLGQPREGGALRLARKRGKDWALWGDGQPLLEALAKRDVKLVASLLEHEDAEVRAATCALIGRTDQAQAALPLLSGRLRDEDADVRLCAVEGIVAGADARAAWPLARGLSRESPGQVRDAMRDALGRLPARETVGHLQGLFERPDVADRRAAVIAVDAMGKVEGMPIMIKALDDADRTVRLEGLRALEKAHRAPALRAKVGEALAAIRRIGLDRTDRELYNLARSLHLAVAGRLPDAR